MLFDYGIIGKLIFLILGCLWCKEIVGRIHEDLDCLKNSKNNVQRGVVIFFWVLTLIIALTIANFLVGLVYNVLDFF